MSDEHVLRVALPTDLSDEAAATLIQFLYELTTALENHYAAQLRRYYHPGDERQGDLWCDNDPPF